MNRQLFLYLMVLLAFSPYKLFVSCGGALGDAISTAAANRYNAHVLPPSEQHHRPHVIHSEHQASHAQQPHHHSSGSPGSVGGSSNAHAVGSHYHQTSGSGHVDHRNSYNLLSEAMSQAVSNEFHAMGSGSADGACQADDLDCYSGNMQDRLGMEAIRTLHRQLDDDDNGNIDLSESDDFLREELKYDSGYEKRQKAFHFNDDMHISVKELWEAWLRSEVHNWTIEQTTDWLAQSVQLPQYVDLFKQHKVTGAALPRLAVNNMHYVSNVLGIKDPIHKQKIALKSMDVVLFGPPRETGTRWKDYILVTLLLSAIIGCWYAYQQNKNAKRHLRRMAQDMEGLQRAEQSLQEMQKELERARMEQENVATEKLDLERRLKEAPALSTSNSDLEVQKLKKEIEMLRTELSRAEIELVDNCWSPPPQLQSWLQYTYELESKNHLKKRVSAEKQLQCAREACEKLRKKRSSLVGAFVSTHGKSIDDVDRSIVEARTSLSEVTNELQERLHRWKQIESCLGLNIVNNNGLSYLENMLYGRGNGSNKSSRGRVTSSTDDLDDDSVQGFHDNYSRISAPSGVIGSSANTIRDDSSCSDDGADTQSVQFYLGGSSTPIINTGPSSNAAPHRSLHPLETFNHIGNNVPATPASASPSVTNIALSSVPPNTPQPNAISSSSPPLPTHNEHSSLPLNDSIHSILGDDSHRSPSVSSERSIPVPPRSKKQVLPPVVPPPPSGPIGKAPHPPPRKSALSEIIIPHSADLVPIEIYTYLSKQYQPQAKSNSCVVQQQQPNSSNTSLTPPTSSAIKRVGLGKMVKQHSTASQQSTSSTSSSVQSAPSNVPDTTTRREQSPVQSNTSSHDRIRERDTADRDQQQSHSISSFLAKQMSSSLQSLYGKPLHGGSGSAGTNTTTTATSAVIETSAHSDTQMEHLRQQQGDVGSNSEGGDLKKKRRKLRFPFGGKKSTSNNSGNKSKSSNS